MRVITPSPTHTSKNFMFTNLVPRICSISASFSPSTLLSKFMIQTHWGLRVSSLLFLQTLSLPYHMEDAETALKSSALHCRVLDKSVKTKSFQISVIVNAVIYNRTVFVRWRWGGVPNLIHCGEILFHLPLGKWFSNLDMHLNHIAMLTGPCPVYPSGLPKQSKLLLTRCVPAFLIQRT